MIFNQVATSILAGNFIASAVAIPINTTAQIEDQCKVLDYHQNFYPLNILKYHVERNSHVKDVVSFLDDHDDSSQPWLQERSCVSRRSPSLHHLERGVLGYDANTVSNGTEKGLGAILCETQGCKRCCQWYREEQTVDIETNRYPKCPEQTPQYTYPLYPTTGNAFIWTDEPSSSAGLTAVSRANVPRVDEEGAPLLDYLIWGAQCDDLRSGSVLCNQIYFEDQSRNKDCCSWYPDHFIRFIPEHRWPICVSNTIVYPYPWFPDHGRPFIWMDAPDVFPYRSFVE
jgi:hypothetical protein